MTEKLLELLELFKTGKASYKERQMLLEALSLDEESLKRWLESAYEQEISNEINIISKERSEEIFRRIQLGKVVASQNNSKARIVRLSRQWIPWVVAASVIGILAISIFYLGNGNKNKQLLVSAVPANKLNQAVNNTNEPIEITLEDGSGIIIQPKSGISYYKPFGNKRDVSLTGMATFHIAKDATRPFTVFADNIATTALGTVFSIDASNQNILIKLMEGKVVVRSTNAIATLKDTYLKPGQQLLINQQKGVYTLDKFRLSSDHLVTVPDRYKVNQSKKKDSNSYALIFKKTPLEKVF